MHISEWILITREFLFITKLLQSGLDFIFLESQFNGFCFEMMVMTRMKTLKMLTSPFLFSCATRPYERGSEQVWSDVQERSGSQTSGTPNASGTVVAYFGESCKNSRKVWSFVPHPLPPLRDKCPFITYRKYPLIQLTKP